MVDLVIIDAKVGNKKKDGIKCKEEDISNREFYISEKLTETQAIS